MLEKYIYMCLHYFVYVLAISLAMELTFSPHKLAIIFNQMSYSYTDTYC